jgi:3D-(3,5/4)-trihydroxycyclohexane-1,2-dione acylhydrolase (decyclizing)
MGRVRLTAAQALIRFLQAQYSERDGDRRRAIPALWGILGHGNVCGIGQAVSEQGAALPLLQPKHEQAMVHAALGYAKASRRLATLACTASIGPGATNLVTGAATATTNRLPVLLFAGDTYATRRQGVVLQQLEHPSHADWSVNDCLRPVSRYFDRIARPEQLLAALPEAMRVLLDPAETGAVTVALHQDVQGEAFDYPESFFAERTWHVPRRPPERYELDDAVAVLSAAERPLIVAGGGVWYSGAEEALAAVAELLGAPVAETSAGKGSYRGPLLAGGIGVNGTRAANALAADADAVLCVGTRLSDFTTASRSLFQAPGVRFVGLNVCATDAHKLSAFPLVADARVALQALAAALRDRAPNGARREQAAAAVTEWRSELAADLQPNGARMSGGELLAELNRCVRAGDWVVAAAGSPPGDLLKLWEAPDGSHAHIEFAFSCMGHELPAGLGIRMADPEAGEVYVVIGDGTYLMAATELATAVQERLKVTVVLIVNGGYQSIHALQRASGSPSLATEFRNHDDCEPLTVDFAANARSLGCRAVQVSAAGELTAALEAARAVSESTVVVCAVEPHRGLLGSGAFWDLGVAEVSRRAETRAAGAAMQRGRRAQRHYAWRGG